LTKEKQDGPGYKRSDEEQRMGKRNMKITGRAAGRYLSYPFTNPQKKN
jgi:hypothetical protein